MADELFIDNIKSCDELYLLVRDEERCIKYKIYMQNLWDIYQPFADKDFPKQLSQDLHARFWEMYLTCTLIDNSFTVVPKQTRAKGPDIRIEHTSTTIWVESAVPTSGDLSKPDSVPNLQMDIAQKVPDDQIVLRYLSVIKDKYKKYHKYLKDETITDKDCYVIALNGCKTRHGDSGLPRIVRSVLPFGPEVFTINTRSKAESWGYQYRPSLKKASGCGVDTDIFTRQEYQYISAVMFSKVDVFNMTSIMGEDFIIVRNPLAVIQLPDDFPKVGLEYKAELSQSRPTLSYRKLR